MKFIINNICLLVLLVTSTIITTTTSSPLPFYPSSTSSSSSSLSSSSTSTSHILWNTSHPYAIYTSTSISRNNQNNDNSALAYLTAGLSKVNAPQDPDQAEFYALPGNGVPLWKDKGPQIQVTSSRNGKLVATLAYDRKTKIGRVEKYILGKNKPDWVYKLSNAMPGSESAIVASDDGTTISLAWYNFNKNVSTITTFRWDNSKHPSGKPDTTTTYEEQSGIYLPINLCLSADGSVAAFHLHEDVRVVDTTSGKRRWGKHLGYMDGVIDISQDGSYLAVGFENMVLFQWDHKVYTYKEVWTILPPNGAIIAHDVGISKGDRVVIGIAWSDRNYKQNIIQTFNTSSSTPMMQYSYDKDTGNLQDLVSSIRITDDSMFMVVGSWGNQSAENPQVRVFRTQPNSLFNNNNNNNDLLLAEFQMPGSVFAADILTVDKKNIINSKNGEEQVQATLFVSAGSKKVHANTRGRGGHLLAAKVEVQ